MIYYQVVQGALDKHTQISDHVNALVALVKRDNLNRDYQTDEFVVIKHDTDKNTHEIVRE